jgi:hypothetical protein
METEGTRCNRGLITFSLLLLVAYKKHGLSQFQSSKVPAGQAGPDRS